LNFKIKIKVDSPGKFAIMGNDTSKEKVLPPPDLTRGYLPGIPVYLFVPRDSQRQMIEISSEKQTEQQKLWSLCCRMDLGIFPFGYTFSFLIVDPTDTGPRGVKSPRIFLISAWNPYGQELDMEMLLCWTELFNEELGRGRAPRGLFCVPIQEHLQHVFGDKKPDAIPGHPRGWQTLLPENGLVPDPILQSGESFSQQNIEKQMPFPQQANRHWSPFPSVAVWGTRGLSTFPEAESVLEMLIRSGIDAVWTEGKMYGIRIVVVPDDYPYLLLGALFSKHPVIFLKVSQVLEKGVFGKRVNPRFRQLVKVAESNYVPTPEEQEDTDTWEVVNLDDAKPSPEKSL